MQKHGNRKGLLQVLSSHNHGNAGVEEKSQPYVSVVQHISLMGIFCYIISRHITLYHVMLYYIMVYYII